jgi:hypothetical protein
VVVLVESDAFSLERGGRGGGEPSRREVLGDEARKLKSGDFVLIHKGQISSIEETK